MIRALLLTACLAVVVAPARAQVLEGWGGSPTNGAPTEQPFDCRSYSGSHSIVFSIVPPVDLPGVRGFSVDLSVATGSPGVCDCFCPGSCVVPNLPAYWDLSANGCRPNSITGAAGFPADDGTTAVSNEVFAGALVMTQPYAIAIGSSGYYGNPTPYTYGHFVVQGALPSGTTATLLAGQEYYVATVTIRNSGTTACEGCCTSVGFAANVSVDLGLSSTFHLIPGTPAYWQGYQGGACNPVPARTATWGSLKSAYR